MPMLLFFLFFTSSICCAQSDSINSQWNNCTIDTLTLDDGTLSRINIEQQEWSKSKGQPVTNFWERVYYADGNLRSEVTGEKFYNGNGYFKVKSVKKVFNREGKRVSTKRDEYKIASFI